MASPLKVLSQFITKVTRHRQLENGRKRRRLLMESLEHRNLLAIDSLAAITGTVYLDGSVNTPVESAMVDLYLDGGDGVLDRGVVGGDDTSIGSDATDALGVYRFDGLQAGAYFVEQRPISGILQHPGDSVQTVTISAIDAAGVKGMTIDSFDQTTQLVEAPDDMLPSESAENVESGEAVGGERDLAVERDSNSGRVRLAANDLSSGFLELTTSSGTLGKGTATWDGDDNDSAALVTTGLGGIDLTESGANTAFRLAVGADHTGVMLTLRVYSDAVNWSSVTFEVTDTGSAIPDTNAPTLLAFDALVTQGGTGADLTSVGAIEVEIQGVVDVQVGFDDLGMIGPTYFTADFANFEPLSLGNLVWDDANNNGVFDGGESGIENVVVNLYEDTDGSGGWTIGDASLDSDTTDANGNFLFQNLFPGDYILQVDPANFDIASPLAVYVSSNDSAAADPDVDPSDNDDNGDPLTDQGVVTYAVTLLAGTEPTDDGDTDANTNLSVDFGFTPASDLMVVKSDAPDPVVAGEDLTYTLVVTNNGPADDTGVVVTDTLPPGVTFKSVTVVERPSITPDHTAGAITAQIGDLANGETVTVLIVVTVDSGRTQLLQNAAEVDGDNYDPNPENNTSGVETAVETEIDLAITKEAGEGSVYVGEDLVYTLVVTNNGPSDATGVIVSDPVPTGVTLVGRSTSQGTISDSGGVITAELGNMASGATATIVITVNVDADAPVELENTATVVGSGAEPEQILDNNTDTVLTEVKPLIDLAIDKTVDLDVVNPGGQLVYTVLVTNNGPSDATGVTVTDQLPSGVTFVSAVPDQGSASETGGIVTVDLGNLASGTDAEVTITVNVDLAAAGTLDNDASVLGNEDEVTQANNTDDASTNVNPVIDLEIEKSVDLATVDVGGELTYTLLVSNNGPSGATGVVVTDTLPAGVSYKSANSTLGLIAESGGVVTVDMGNLASGAGATITIVVDVNLDAAGTLDNVATVDGNEDEVTDTNNTANASTDVNPLIDLIVTKTDSPDPVAVNGQLVYTLVVTNNGPSDATGVTVQDTLPSAVSYDTSTTSQGTISVSGGNVTASLGNLASGVSATITLTVDVLPTASGTLLNTAVVSGNEDETNGDNNEATAETTVSPRVDMAIIKADSPDPVVAGEQLTYTLSIENNGPSNATGVEVIDTLPAGVTYVSGSSTLGTVSHAGGVVTIDVGNVSTSGTVVVTILVDVDPSVRGTITNTAVVSSTEVDIDSGNNTDDEPTTVQGRVDLAVTKADSPDPVTAGEELTYTLTVTNNGPSDATDVELTDTLPDEVVFVSGSATQGSVTHSAGIATATLGDLAVGETATVTIVVQVAPETFDAISNTAAVSAAEQELDSTDNTTVEPTAVDELLSSIAGFVYLDLDNDGQMDEGELPIPGVTVRLTGTNRATGTDADGDAVALEAVTDENGYFKFENLHRGTYQLIESQPERYLDGLDTLGSLLAAVANNDEFSQLELPPGVDAVNYLFGERAPSFSKRRFLSSR